MWVPPDHVDIAPGYEQQDISDRKRDNELFPLASGREPDAAITLHQHDATLWVATLQTGTRVTIPGAPFVHVMVSNGAANLAGAGALATGDAVRLTDAGALDLEATDHGTEVTVWEMWSELAIG